jgi:hypothetical protein
VLSAREFAEGAQVVLFFEAADCIFLAETKETLP